MQKRLENLQHSSDLAQIASNPQFNENDAIYKSIDRGDRSPNEKPKNFEKPAASQMNPQQARILERKQSVNTMRFCSFDQDNNLNNHVS